MEDNLIPGGDFVSEAGGDEQTQAPGNPAGFIDSDAGSGPPPGPTTRRRPVIVCMGS